jgi:hypothetical protein
MPPEDRSRSDKLLEVVESVAQHREEIVVGVIDG